jgi:hypothetical protein
MALTWEQHQQNIFAGESGGDYDALYGYQNRPDGKFSGVKVSDMPIADVIKFTSPSGEYGQYVKGQVGRVATPVGAYQVVGSTLRGAVEALGLDPSQKFDKATQDKIGQYILKTQGTGAWEGYGKGGAAMAQEPQKPQGLLGGLLGGQGIGGALGLSPEFSDKLAMAVMAGSGDARLQPLIAQRAASMKERNIQGRKAEQANATAKYLEGIGQTDLANLLREGGIDAKTAFSAIGKAKDTALIRQAKAAGLVEGTPEFSKYILSGGNIYSQETALMANLPKPEAGKMYEFDRDDNGQISNVRLINISGSKADIEEQQRQEKLRKAGQQTATGQSVVSRGVSKALRMIEENTGILPVAGVMGRFAAEYLPDQESRDLRRTLDTLKASTAFTRLQQMRDASQTGGALGNVSNVELDLLMSAYGSLAQDLSEKELVDNLKEIERLMGQIEADPVAMAYFNDGIDLRGTELDLQVKKGATQPSDGAKRLRFDAQGNLIND